MSGYWQRVAEIDEVEWPDSAVLICDRAVIDSAPQALRGRVIPVDGGESLKTLASIERLAQAVLEIRASRPLCLIAMGGGSVGDAVGFLASILWRGVELWHVPTTLLAAVDSAHGGKTAVNLGTAKNQLGTFWEATRTVFAESFLQTMPRSLRAEGLTELVKALWLGDAAALDVLDLVGSSELAFAPYPAVGVTLGRLLDAAVAVKHGIVDRDPRERHGIRTYLNLGHTVAHGLELCCQAPHGVSVAWGMACAAQISWQRGLLDAESFERLIRHVHPLMGAIALQPEPDGFRGAIGRDKKTVDGRLRSVLLRGPADPIVVDDVSATDWWVALGEVRATVFDRPLRVCLRGHRAATLAIAASKSELNRALVIASLRGDPAEFELDSSADDVRAMRAGITALGRGEVADAGAGGTTFRFLIAVAVSQPEGGRIRIAEQLAARPHDPLLDALRAAGVEVVREGLEFSLGPLPRGPVEFRVDASASSQFASALALLRAARPDVSVTVTGDVASAGYLSMTLSMLEQSPLRVTSDASSAAVWRVLNALGAQVTFSTEPGDLQPDSAVERLLWAHDDPTPVELDVGATPDLVPVLTAYAALSAPSVRLFGAPHLRHKESNRIEDLVAAFAEVGVDVVATSDGIEVRAGIQSPRIDARFDPRADHRLAFAALVLSTRGPIWLTDPRCVTKSYPTVFEDACAAGFVVDV